MNGAKSDMKRTFDCHYFVTSIFNQFFLSIKTAYNYNKSTVIQRGGSKVFREPGYFEEFVIYPLERIRERLLKAKTIDDLEDILDDFVILNYKLKIEKFSYNILSSFYNDTREYLKEILNSEGTKVDIGIKVKNLSLSDTKNITIKLKTNKNLFGYYLINKDEAEIRNIPFGSFGITVFINGHRKIIKRNIIKNDLIEIDLRDWDFENKEVATTPEDIIIEGNPEYKDITEYDTTHGVPIPVMCSECKKPIKKGDKRQCSYCGNYFCSQHSEPNLKVKEGGHRCSAYTPRGHVVQRVSKGAPKSQPLHVVCSKCKKKIDRNEDNYCIYCKKYFCPEHFIPIDHNCPSLKDYPSPREDEFKRKIPTKKIVIALIILAFGLLIWYLLAHSNSSQDVKSITESIVTQKNFSFTIPYILDYPAKMIYFPSKCGGEVNESYIGSPLREKLDEGWKIKYEDQTAHSTTTQKIIVKYTINEMTIITKSDESGVENPTIISRFLSFLDRISIGKSLNCTDGTLYNQCSNNKPLYCFNGTLVKNSTFCGCQYDYRVKGNDCELIPRCSDRTVYGECSNNKPYYCSNGNLIKKSSICSCPSDEVSQYDDCVSKYDVGPKEINLYINGQITPYTVYKGLNDYLASLPRSIMYYSVPPTTKDFIMKKLDDEEQKKKLDSLVDKIEGITPNKDEQAKIAITMVQLIPYDYTGFTTGDVSGKYPYEVLYTNTGVCSEKAQLLVYLLRGLGFGTAILEFTAENHDAVGIKCPSQYTYKDTGYCFVESTQLSYIGDSSESYVGVGQLKSTPEVIVISDGYSLSSIQ